MQLWIRIDKDSSLYKVNESHSESNYIKLKFVILIVESLLFQYQCFKYYHIYFMESELYAFCKKKGTSGMIPMELLDFRSFLPPLLNTREAAASMEIILYHQRRKLFKMSEGKGKI